MVKENFEIQPFQMLQIDSKYHDNSRNTMNTRKTANPANSQYSNYLENKNLMYGEIFKIPGDFQVFQVFQVIFLIPGDFQEFQVFQSS